MNQGWISPPWDPGIEGPLGTVFRFCKLLEESSSVRATYCCYRAVLPLVSTEECWTWRGSWSSRQRASAQPHSPLPLPFCFRSFIGPFTEGLPSLKWNLVLTARKIPATSGGRQNVGQL